MNILNYCKSYFSGFQEIAAPNTNKAKSLALLKICSYFTIAIPLTFAAIYGIASLYGRVAKKEHLSEQDNKIKEQAKKVILKEQKQVSGSSLANKVVVEEENPFLDITISKAIKKEITEGKLTQKETKKDYEHLSHARKLPKLLGFNQYAPEKFAMLMPGIALIAALLAKKNKISNLWVCQTNQAFRDKLTAIKNSAGDQRHALIVQTHSSGSSPGQAKSVDFEQHKIAVCVEKIGDHLHIYMLETMLHSANTITLSQINLEEGKPFTEQELILANMNAIGLKKENTTIYVPTVRREFGSGCSTFALKDAVSFLKDPEFRKRSVISTNERLKLPKSQIELKDIKALPSEYMKMTQSLSTIKKYKAEHNTLALKPFIFSSKNKTLAASLAKYSLPNDKGDMQNLYIAHHVLKYQVAILEIMKRKTDQEIEKLIEPILLG